LAILLLNCNNTQKKMEIQQILTDKDENIRQMFLDLSKIQN
jgi:hypothetical protein